MEPLRAVVARLKEEEDEMRRELVLSGKLPLLEEFLAQKNALLGEEAKLRSELEGKEDALSSARLALCEVDMSAVPADDAEKAALYVEWKRVQWEQNESERRRREQAHTALAHARSEGEREAILRELQKRTEIYALEQEEAKFTREANEARAHTAALEAQMREAADEMRALREGELILILFTVTLCANPANDLTCPPHILSFKNIALREEFESMRTALVLDKTVKDAQVATLAEHRARLERAERSFDASLAAEKARVEAEMESVWGPRLAAARAESAAAVARERATVEAKMATLRGTLEERYRAGFEPLLREAEKRLDAESRRTSALREQLAAQEHELRSLEEEARRHGHADASASAAAAAGGERVDIEEVRRVQGELRVLWEQLDTPPEEIAAFLAELDLAPSEAGSAADVFTVASKRLGQ